jgi:hypothetical protein
MHKEVWYSPENNDSTFLRKTLVSTYKSTRRYNPEDKHREVLLVNLLENLRLDERERNGRHSGSWPMAALVLFLFI